MIPKNDTKNGDIFKRCRVDDPLQLYINLMTMIEMIEMTQVMIMITNNNGFKNFKIERKTIGLTPIRLNQENISKINKYKNPIKSLKRLYKY